MAEIKVTVPLLTDGNWPFWKRVMLAALAEKGLQEATIGEDEAPVLDVPQHATPEERAVLERTFAQRQAEHMKRRRQATVMILVALTEKHNFLIPPDDGNPAVLWTSLVNHFESKTVFNICAVEGKLGRLTIKETDDPVIWIRKRIELYDQLSALGQPVPENQKCVTTLTMLPDSYLPLYTSLTVQAGMGALTMKLLCEHLETFRRTKTSQVERAYVSDGSFRGRGRGGRRGGWRGRGATGSGSGWRGRSGPGGQTTFSGQCYGCGQRGHVKRFCPNATGETHATTYASQTGSGGFAFVTKMSCTSNAIVIDSGASNHMTNQTLSKDFQALSPHQPVTLGDGRRVWAIGMGNL